MHSGNVHPDISISCAMSAVVDFVDSPVPSLATLRRNAGIDPLGYIQSQAHNDFRQQNESIALLEAFLQW